MPLGCRFAPFAILLISIFPLLFAPSNDAYLRISKGKPIDTDGKISPGEWDDANFVEIRVSADWAVRVGAKRDSENLNFVFEGVKHGDERLFPEVLIDPQNRKSSRWKPGEWWFHISNNLCEGNGEPNVYTKGGVFQCSHAKRGWEGNNPPGPNTNVVEVSISFEKLGIQPSAGMTIGIAFDMTDATGDDKQKFLYWPKTATIKSPITWGTADIE